MKKPLREIDTERLQDHKGAGPGLELPRHGAWSFPPFEIDAVKRTERPSKLRATFTVRLPGLAIEKCLYFVTPSNTFVSGPSTKAPWAKGGYERPVHFDEELADEMLAVLEMRLAAIEAQDAID